MAKHNRIGSLCLAAAIMLVMLLALSPCVNAVSPELDRLCSVTFTMAYNGKALAGGSLRMYRIAEWTEQNGVYTFEWVPELADCGLNLSDKDTEKFAQRISMLVESRSLPAYVQPIDENGRASFIDLPCGLYVVYQTEPAPGYKPINAYCVSLPLLMLNETLVYDIQAVPKPRPEKPNTTAPASDEDSTDEATTVAPSDRPTDVLPQTGQLWWPCWTLAIFGALSLGLGLILRILFRQTTEESDE